MILEIADTCIAPGQQSAFEVAIVGSFFAGPPQAEHFTLVGESA